jgi:arsenate reductase
MEIKKSFYPELQKTIFDLHPEELSEEKKEILQVLIGYIQDKIDKNEAIFLNFICTHNSRRSQFAQIWAQTAAYSFGIDIRCFSGGVEVTAFNERAVASVKRAGFRIRQIKDGENPVYEVSFSKDAATLLCFSKLYNDQVNKAVHFAAVMTCSDAEANCPFIPGTEKRIPVLYDDPKEFDGTPLEVQKYDERSHQIAAEMFYVFSKINNG